MSDSKKISAAREVIGKHDRQYLISHLMGEQWDPEDMESASVALAIIDRAERGDMFAAKIITDRISPCPRGRQGRFLHIGYKDVSSMRGIAKAAEHIWSRVSDGFITPAEANQLVSLLEVTGRLHESSEVVDRVSRIEQVLLSGGRLTLEGFGACKLSVDSQPTADN